MTWHGESVRYVWNIPVTHTLVYKNHAIQIILYVYIPDNIANYWLSPVSIESMEENMSL